MKRIIRLGGFLVIVSLVGLLVLGTFMYETFARAAPNCEATPDAQDKTPADYDMAQYDDVRFPSAEDGLDIAAFFIPAAVDSDSAPTVILTHGIGACRRIDHSLSPARMLHNAGFNTLVMDLRNMGDSEVDNGRIGGGNKEYRDVIGAVDYLVDERGLGENGIGFYGFSMGAATGLIAAGIDERIMAVWSDAAYADLEFVIDDVLAEMGMPILKQPALLMGRILHNSDPTSHDPVDFAVQMGERPVYLVHGERDHLVDFRNMVALAEALAAVGVPYTTWETQSGHVESLQDQRDEYEARLVAFFTSILVG